LHLVEIAELIEGKRGYKIAAKRNYLQKTFFLQSATGLANRSAARLITAAKLRLRNGSTWLKLPPGSPRGGLITQASVLKITANGTTTSPVLRGVWILERILGDPPAPPPPGVPALEPDTRGATTIREQLDKHRSSRSCSVCHSKIDPAGFALENFDVLGGWRDRYRSIDEGAPVAGIGKNGFPITFRLAKPVDARISKAGKRRDFLIIQYCVRNAINATLKLAG